MPESPLVSILTLGCKLNLADSDSLSGLLSESGYRVTHRLCESDAVVVNTCSVTRIADQKSRKLIRAARRLSPSAAIAVTGCYPANAANIDFRDLGADIVSGTGRAARLELVASLRAALSESSRTHTTSRTPAAGPLRSRAFVEAQSGCDDVCAFCIIPRTRGRERSRTAEEICRELDGAAAAGAREAVVTGTQLGAWGRELPGGPQLPELLGEVLARTDVARLRLSSLQPEAITPELLALWEDPRLMPHFHLALQSGSDRVLAGMRRRYTAQEFLLAAERIRAAVPDAAITTDVIVGFPGESEEDFDQTVGLCESVAFSRIHGFPYSVRQGTLAARLPEQIPAEVKRQRMSRLLEVGAKLAAEYENRFLGTIRPVLWESSDAGSDLDSRSFEGYTDNYIRVKADGRGLGGRIMPALLKREDGVVVAVSAAN